MRKWYIFVLLMLVTVSAYSYDGVSYVIGSGRKATTTAGTALGVDWKVVQNDVRLQPIWSVKKEDALATLVESKTEIGKIDVTKYSGVDSQKIIHPYQAEDKINE